MTLLVELVIGGVAATTTSFPAPRWWEQAGASIRIVGPQCALTGLPTAVAAAGSAATAPLPSQLRGLPAFLALLDTLAESKVSSLQLRTAYDPGTGA